MPYKDKQKEREHRKLYYQNNKDNILLNNKKWRLNNLEKSKSNVKDYYNKHKQQAIDSAKRWKKRNPDKVKEGQRLYNIKNREKKLIKAKEYNNREDVKKKKKEWALNPGRIEIKLTKQREYRKLHPEKARDYMRSRRENDVMFKINQALRHRLNMALKGNFKIGSAIRDLGCSIPELKLHLEKQFKDGMDWSNWTITGWHIDHILPLDSFDLLDREELLKACHYTNLQPLWYVENIRKSNKL